MSLTRFQEILVRALESVPYGEVTSFKLIAEALGDPIAALAVRNECMKLAKLMPEIPWWRAVSSEGKPLPGALDMLKKEYSVDKLRRREFYRDLDAWPILRIMREDQIRLSRRLVFEKLRDAEIAAGVDVSYSGERAVAVCVTLDNELKVKEVRYEKFRPQIPYIPTYLAFREMRGMYPSSMRCEFDVIFVDGHGTMHPRNFGEASHLGLILGRPSIGVAKSRLVGRVIGDEVRVKGQIKGKIVSGGYVSPGHLTDLESSIMVAKKFWPSGKQPLPLLMAHKLSKEAILGR